MLEDGAEAGLAEVPQGVRKGVKEDPDQEVEEESLQLRNLEGSEISNLVRGEPIQFVIKCFLSLSLFIRSRKRQDIEGGGGRGGGLRRVKSAGSLRRSRCGLFIINS